MNILRIEVYNDEELLDENIELDSRAFFNRVLMQIAYKHKVAKPTKEELINSKEGLENRLNRKLSSEEYNELLKCKLNEYEKYFIKLLYNKTIVEITNVDYFIDALLEFDYGNLEDIYEYLEDFDEITDIVITII